MRLISIRSPFLAVVGTAVLAVSFAACGGGGGGGGPVPTPMPTVAPSPAAASQSVSLGAAPQTATFATLSSGAAGAIGFPAATSGTATTTVTEQTTLPASEPTPAKALSAAARRRIQTLGGAVNVLLYVTVTPSATLTFGTVPSFTLTFPAGTLGTEQK